MAPDLTDVPPDIDSLESTTERALNNLEAAREQKQAVDGEIASVGESMVIAAADEYERAIQLLDSYQDSATGTGNFQAYVEFQDRFIGLVEELPKSIPEREAFEIAADRLDQRRLNKSDFEAARKDLAPVATYRELLNQRQEAADALASAEREVSQARQAVTEAIEYYKLLCSYSDVDFSVSTTALSEPISEYNDSVHQDFTEFYETASISAVISFLERTESFPLISYQAPPQDLSQFIRQSPDAGDSIPTLLEYADFSGSKLDHYAADPALLQTTVGVHRTYLERLSAEPLSISIPPPAAGRLQFFTSEAISVLGRFAREETIAAIRTVRDITFEPVYNKYRLALAAEVNLSDAARQLLKNKRAEAGKKELLSLQETIDSALNT